MLNWLKNTATSAYDSATQQAAQLATKFKDKQTAEALIAVMTGTAHVDADGLEDKERAKMKDSFDLHPILKQFDRAVLLKKFGELCNAFQLDKEEGIEACLSELRDVAQADLDKRKAVMRMGRAMAAADGEVDDAERAFLILCCRALRLDPAEEKL